MAVSSPIAVSSDSYLIIVTGFSGKVFTHTFMEREILSTSSAVASIRGFSRFSEIMFHRLVRHTDPFLQIFGLAGLEPVGLCLSVHGLVEYQVLVC